MTWTTNLRKDKKKKQAPIDDFDDEPETDEYDDEPIPEKKKKGQPEPDKSILDGFGSRLMKIFTEPEHLYDDDDENPDK